MYLKNSLGTGENMKKYRVTLAACFPGACIGHPGPHAIMVANDPVSNPGD